MLGLGKTDRGDDRRDLRHGDLQLASLGGMMPSSGSQGSAPPLNLNHYATKKTVAESMLDVALFLANVTHMKTVIEQGAGFRYYIAVLTLISFSLALQIIAGVLFIIMARRDITDSTQQHRLNILNNTATALVFIIIIINIFITTFGMERTGLFPRRHPHGYY